MQSISTNKEFIILKNRIINIDSITSISIDRQYIHTTNNKDKIGVMYTSYRNEGSSIKVTYPNLKLIPSDFNIVVILINNEKYREKFDINNVKDLKSLRNSLESITNYIGRSKVLMLLNEVELSLESLRLPEMIKMSDEIDEEINNTGLFSNK